MVVFSRVAIKQDVRFHSRRLMWILTTASMVLLISSIAAHRSTAQEAVDPADDTEVAGEDTSIDLPDGLSPDDEVYELMRLFVDSLDEIDRNYVEEIDRRELIEAAIDGMLQRLDQHSMFIGPDEMEGFRDSIENEYGGIGVQVSIESGQLTVISPIFGSPAYRQGIMAGDTILALEGQSTEGMTLDDAVDLTKGEVGTIVRVKVRHAHNDEIEELEIPRAMIKLDTVLGDRRSDDDEWNFLIDEERRIGYIRLTAFGRRTPIELRKVLRSLQEQEMKGLVLDLRFNPGGLLSAAIQISDFFVDEGKIVSTAGRNTRERTWNASSRGTFNGFPIVVLINRYSASASEIVAACLKDQNRAIVVGERSFGKGSVQNVIPLEDGISALKLTTAGYLRPNGSNIHRSADATEEDVWGVRPSEGFELAYTDKENGDYLMYRRDRDIIDHREPMPGEDEPDDTSFEDRQLSMALDYLYQRIGVDANSDD